MGYKFTSHKGYMAAIVTRDRQSQREMAQQ